MKVGPSGSDYRIRSQTTWKLYSLRVGVRSVLGKGETRFHQVCSEEMNASELLMKHRNSLNVIKTKPWTGLKDESRGNLFYCLGGDRCIESMNSDTGFCRKHGNLSL